MNDEENEPHQDGTLAPFIDGLEMRLEGIDDDGQRDILWFTLGFFKRKDRGDSMDVTDVLWVVLKGIEYIEARDLLEASEID